MTCSTCTAAHTTCCRRVGRRLFSVFPVILFDHILSSVYQKERVLRHVQHRPVARLHYDQDVGGSHVLGQS